VLLDWSQNTAAKTTIAPYSLRGGRDAPFVAAPRTWEEVEQGAEGDGRLRQLQMDEVLRRVSRNGDLFGQVLSG
jgi:bifunctional non-homologous end joining protein LigD